MDREEALFKVKGYLTDYLPSDKYEEVGGNYECCYRICLQNRL